MTIEIPPAPTKPRRLVYMGTPEMAVTPLTALHEAGFEIGLVITGKDKRRGRRSKPTPTSVAAKAQELGLAISHDPEDAVHAGADLGVVVAYGRILKPPLLGALPLINLHFSLLPRWRGAAPVQRAILSGDTQTGVAVMDVAEGLDQGGVYATAVTEIGDSETAIALSGRLTAIGAELLVKTLSEPVAVPMPQAGEVTYAEKLSTAEMEINWNQPAPHINRYVRVGGAWTTFRGKRLKIVESQPLDSSEIDELRNTSDVVNAPVGGVFADVVRCGQDALRLVKVQPAGKAPMEVVAWLNGTQPESGEQFTMTSGKK